MNEKITLRQAVIVEGKYDKIKLSSVIDAVIITTDGFRIYKDKEKMALIRRFAAHDGIIILTDSDGAGFQIRNHLKGSIPDGKIFNVYIPDIFGKEKRKEKPSGEGKLGVEGMSAEILKKAFEKAGIFSEENAENNTEPHITKEILADFGFIGRNNSAEKREALQKQLELPEHLSAKALVEALNVMMTVEEFEKTAEQFR